MAQDDAATFLPQKLLKLCSDGLGDAAKALDTPDFVALDGDFAAHRLGALGDDHDGVGLAVVELALEVSNNVFNGVGKFGDEDDVGAASESGVQGDPSGVAA